MNKERILDCTMSAIVGAAIAIVVFIYFGEAYVTEDQGIRIC